MTGAMPVTEAAPAGDGGAPEAAAGQPWWGRLLVVAADRRTPLAILALLVLGWCVVMGRLIVLRHERFATYGFDEGIFDQFFWLLSQGQQFNTVRGVTLAGHHASFAFLLFAPLVWVGGGPNLWNVIHTVAVAATAVPLFLLVRDKVGRPWVGLAVGVVWLLQPTSQWLVWEGFHPEGMALPFLVGTYLFGERLLASRRERAEALVASGEHGEPGVRTALPRNPLARWRATRPLPLTRDERRTRWAFVACFALTITWKEDLALALAGMALVWLLRRQWRFGLQVLVVAALWFAVLGMWLVPHFAGGTVYSGIYGDLGKTPGEIVLNSATDPGALLERLDENDAVGYTRQLTQSWAFVPFLAPATLLIGAPQWFTNIISAAAFTFDPRLHYTAIPLAALGISFVEGVRRAWRWWPWLGRGLLVAGLVAAALGARWDGPSPWGDRYRGGTWPLVDSPRNEARHQAMALVPGDAGVSVDYRISPHMTHRQVVYEFPNPWRSWNYGVEAGDKGTPADVGWAIVDTNGISEENQVLLTSLTRSGEFEVRSERDGIVVLERVRPPGEGTGPIVAMG